MDPNWTRDTRKVQKTWAEVGGSNPPRAIFFFIFSHFVKKKFINDHLYFSFMTWNILVTEFCGLYSQMVIADTSVFLGLQKTLPEQGHKYIAKRTGIPDTEVDALCALIASLVAQKNVDPHFDLERAVALLP